MAGGQRQKRGERGRSVPLKEMRAFLEAADVGGPVFDAGVAKGLHHAWTLNEQFENWMGLGLAIVEQRFDAARRLIKARAPLQDPSGCGASALRVACKHGDPDLVHRLLNKGEAAFELGSGYSLFAYAAICGRLDLAEVFRKKGFGRPLPGSTEGAFVHAMAWASPAGVAYLIAHGGRVDEKGWRGQTPLISACQSHSPERGKVIELLLAAGASVADTDQDGAGPLASLAMFGKPEGVEALLARGAAVDAQDGRGCTPLWHACDSFQGNEEIVGLLLAAGADPLAKNDEGLAPIDIARAKAARGLGQMEAVIELHMLQGEVAQTSKASTQRM